MAGRLSSVVRQKKNNGSWQFSNNAYTSIKKRKAI